MGDKKYATIKRNLVNTTITFEWIKKYKFQYQCLLKCQADYMTDSVKWWRENEKGVEFLDMKDTIDQKSSLKISHFRYDSIENVLKHVNSCWGKALKQPNILPAYMIDINSDIHNRKTIKLLTLNHFNPNIDNTESSTSYDGMNDDGRNNIEHQGSSLSTPLELGSIQSNAVNDKTNGPSAALNHSSSSIDFTKSYPTDTLAKLYYTSTPINKKNNLLEITAEKYTPMTHTNEKSIQSENTAVNIYQHLLIVQQLHKNRQK